MTKPNWRPTSATTPTTLGTNNVYLWYDDATADRSASYLFGRCDAWHGSGYTAWSYDAANDWYAVDTGDNNTGCFRHAIGERDAYIEAEMYHTNCYPSNMSTGLIGRYVLGSGSGGTESASHYYASQRSEQSQSGADCSSSGGYSQDGDIVEGSRTSTAIDGTNPGDISRDQWRKQGLAMWGVNNTNGAFWDAEDAATFGPQGWPSVATNANGSDGSDQESVGDWGVLAAQDALQLRNMLIRRYTSPEPTVVSGSEVSYTSLTTCAGDIVFQLRTAADSGGAPDTWSDWLGPTGTDDYYDDPRGGDAINATHADGASDQWIQYRGTFTGDGTCSRILQDITIKF